MKISPPLLGHSKKNRTARLLGVLVVAIGFGAMAASAPAGGFSALIVSFSPSVALGAAEQDGRAPDALAALPFMASPVATPAEPLDERTLQSLTIYGFAPGYEPSGPEFVGSGSEGIGMQPGDTLVMALGTIDHESCGPIGFACFTPAPADAAWSISPPTGARSDAATGRLTIDAATPGGTVLTVRADVEHGRREVERQVHVWTSEANPLVGVWREEAQLACGDQAERTPPLAIEELVFAPDGTFTVTWIPFESYRDYWGTYTFDLDKGTLRLTVSGGNSIPPDVDGDGAFAIDAGGRLVLADLWLGTPPVEAAAARCGHIFVH